MSRFALVAALLLALVAPLPAIANAPTVPPNTTATLNRTFRELKLNDASLGEVVEFLRQTTGANIHVDWQAIESSGLTPQTIVNVRLRAVSLRKVLSLLIAQGAQGTPLSFYVDQGVIEITTREIADRQLITKVYEVQDLLVQNINIQANVGGTNSSTGSNVSGQTGQNLSSSSARPAARSTTPSSSGSATAANGTVNSPGDDLVTLITTVIEPTIWAQNGGPASIRYFRGSLIITAPRSIHERIGGPLE